MLRILGSPQRLCGGLTRREVLRAGGLGLAGLGLADVLRLQDAAATNRHEISTASIGSNYTGSRNYEMRAKTNRE